MGGGRSRRKSDIISGTTGTPCLQRTRELGLERNVGEGRPRRRVATGRWANHWRARRSVALEVATTVIPGTTGEARWGVHSWWAVRGVVVCRIVIMLIGLGIDAVRAVTKLGVFPGARVYARYAADAGLAKVRLNTGGSPAPHSTYLRRAWYLPRQAETHHAESAWSVCGRAAVGGSITGRRCVGTRDRRWRSARGANRNWECLWAFPARRAVYEIDDGTVPKHDRVFHKAKRLGR